MKDRPNNPPATGASDDGQFEMELTDSDILDAMQHVAGYLDISTEDFRTIYHLAHRHATERLFGNIRAVNLMRTGIIPLKPEMTLDEAAKALVRSRGKALPVVDADNHVTGIVTENDFLRQLNVASLLELLLGMQDKSFNLDPRYHATLVSQFMTAPAITVGGQAGFMEIIRAFHQHEGRSLPVVDDHGCLLGLLLRKDFLHYFHLENLL